MFHSDVETAFVDFCINIGQRVECSFFGIVSWVDLMKQ